MEQKSINDSLIGEKKRARELLKRRLMQMQKPECDKASAAIYDRLTSLPELEHAKVVFCYVSMPMEPETRMIIEYLLGQGKKVCVPRCEKNGLMDARTLTSFSELKSTPPYGILEPTTDFELVDASMIDFAIVPGLAFDRSGGRLGRGAGYYDRYLRDSRAGRCGICFEAMLLDAVPKGDLDIPMDIIVTDQTLIRFKHMEDSHA